MHSPISTDNSQLSYKPSFTGSYSTNKESFTSETHVKADGTSVSKVDYSSQSSSYVVSLNGSSSLESNTSFTYTSVGRYNHFSSADSALSQISTAGPNKPEASTSDSRSLSSSSSVNGVDSDPLLDGAKNILTFIENRIATEKSNGASKDELLDLFEQGLKGFQQGFNEAKDILKGSGQLSEEASSAIETLYKQVQLGFDSINEKYINPKEGQADNIAKPENPKAEVSVPSNPSNTSKPLPEAISFATSGSRQSISSNSLLNTLTNNDQNYGDQFRVLGSGNQSALGDLISSLGEVDASVEYGRKDSFDFQLSTLEGDTISIKASNISVFSGNYRIDNTAGDQSVEGMKDKNNFEMNIVGDLNQEESAAIEDLLNQIMSLADEFYNGDVDKAYEAALELGYDRNEIASYSVNLKQTEQFSVAAAYQDIQPNVNNDAETSFNAIADFAQSVLETLNNPENFAVFDYTQLLRGISEQIDKQIKPVSEQSFTDVIDVLVDTASNTDDINVNE